MGYGSKGYDKMASKGNGKVMGQSSGVSKIATTSPQKFDMGKVNKLPMKKNGYCSEAFGYKY